jgi:two-component system, OmpR family, response regulator
VTHTSTGTAVAPRGSQRRPRGILVVDDTEGIRALLDVGLQAAGFAVWLASGGRAGVAAYLKYGLDIDALLLDVRMPGWDGPKTLAAIRALNSDVPCFFMSGDLGLYSEAHLLDLGAAAVFQKPFRLGELTAHLRRLPF